MILICHERSASTSLIILILLFISELNADHTAVESDGGPGWVLRKFQHNPSDIPTESAAKICRPNMTAINVHLDHILVPRTVGSQGHTDVENYIVLTMQDLGYSVERHSFTAETPGGATSTFANIIATWDTSSKRRLVLACHYDSKKFDRFTFLGATDSAFPCAAIIDTAAGLKGYMGKGGALDLSLELVFFDGEEAFRDWTDVDSIYGARRLANDWHAAKYPPDNPHGTKRLDQIDVLVLLDLLGSVDGSVPNLPENALNMFNQFLDAQNQLRLAEGCLLPRDSDLLLPDRSGAGIADDHLPFQQRGVRIVHMIAYPFPDVWHTASDDRSALDSASMHNMAAILRLFTARYLRLRID